MARWNKGLDVDPFVLEAQSTFDNHYYPFGTRKKNIYIPSNLNIIDWLPHVKYKKNNFPSPAIKQLSEWGMFWNCTSAGYTRISKRNNGYIIAVIFFVCQRCIGEI